MVDPWPPHSGNTNIAFNGQKMQTAVERYRTDKVIPPVDPTTTASRRRDAAGRAASSIAAAPAPLAATPARPAPAAATRSQ